MYLTVFLFFLTNISYVYDCFEFQTCIDLSYVSIISHVFDCIENGLVMYLTIFSIDHDISHVFDY